MSLSAGILFAVSSAIGKAITVGGTTYAAYSVASVASKVSRSLHPPSKGEKALRTLNTCKTGILVAAGVVSAGVLLYSMKDLDKMSDDKKSTLVKAMLKARGSQVKIIPMLDSLACPSENIKNKEDKKNENARNRNQTKPQNNGAWENEGNPLGRSDARFQGSRGYNCDRSGDDACRDIAS